MTDEDMKRLREYATLEGSELGEMLALLISLTGYEHFMGSSLYHEIKKTLKENLEWFDTFMKIVEVADTQIYEELVMKDQDD